MEVPQVAKMPGNGEVAPPAPGSTESGETAGAQDLFAMLIAQLLQMSEVVATENAGTGKPVDVDSAAASLVPKQPTGDGVSQGEAMSEEALESLVAQLKSGPMRSSATYRELPVPNEALPVLNEVPAAPTEVLAAPTEVLPVPSQTTPGDKVPAAVAMVDLDPEAVVAEELESLVDPARLDPKPAPKPLKLFYTMMRTAVSRATMNVMSEVAATESAGTGEPVDADPAAASPVPKQPTGSGVSQGEAMSEEVLKSLAAQLKSGPMRSSATYRELPVPNEALPAPIEVLPVPTEVLPVPSQTTPGDKGPAAVAMVDLDPDAVVAEELESLVDQARLDPKPMPKTLRLFETMMRAAVSRATMNVTPEGRGGGVSLATIGSSPDHVETVALEAVTAPPAVSGLAVETDMDTVQVVSERAVPEPAKTTLDNLGRTTLRSIRYLVARGEATMKIRLEPPSLGEVRFEVTSSDRVLSIRLASANPAVREILEGHLGGLRESLVRDGHEVLEISVTADAGSGQSSAHEHRRSATLDGAPRGPASSSRDYDPGAEATGEPEEGVPAHEGNLNLFI